MAPIPEEAVYREVEMNGGYSSACDTYKGQGLQEVWAEAANLLYGLAVDVPEHFCCVIKVIKQVTKVTQIQGRGNKIPPLISPTTQAQMCLGTWSPNQKSEGYDPKVS